MNGRPLLLPRRLLLTIVGLAAFSAPPAATKQTAEFEAGRAWQHLEQLVAIGPRPAGSPALRQARAYITRELARSGLQVMQQPFTVVTPIGRVEMVNLIVRLPGQRPDRILIGGHYDTKLMREGRFVGANDGGSSAAFLMELARVLVGRSRDFTYELIWFDGEEAFCGGWTECGTPDSPDNTYGSRHYVQAARQAHALELTRALVLVDMIADRDLAFLRDTNSTPWLVDLLWATAGRRGHGDVFQQSAMAIEDDHLPFLEAGIAAVDIIDLTYGSWHTTADDLDQISPRGLQIVGDVILAALPAIESSLASRPSARP
jgi:glutaminyl-peptide cyclotransferase